MNKRLDPSLQREGKALACLPDTTIDICDIPEVPDLAWREARRPGVARSSTEPVTLRLDADIVAWFKDHAVSRGFRSEIKRVLRRHVADAEQGSA